MTTTTRDGQVVADQRIGATGQLTIRVAAAQVRLAATDGDRVIVRTPDGVPLPDRIALETTDDGLTIRERDLHGLTFSIGRRHVQLEVEVPARAEVLVDIASGWLDVLGVRGAQRYRLVSAETRLADVAGRIELNTVSGDATIALADATDLAIKSVSGDVSVRGGSLDALRIGTTSGDIRIDSPLVGRTGNTVETLSGDVAIAASSGLRVEARTVSGDLSSDLPNRSEGRMGRRSLVVGDGSVELMFRSVSGDLRIIAAADAIVAGDAARPARPFGDQSEPPADPVRPADPPAPPAPTPPAGPGTAPSPPTSGDARADVAEPTDARRMEILRALEQGTLDVPTAMARLAALDAFEAGTPDPSDRAGASEPAHPAVEPTDG